MRVQILGKEDMHALNEAISMVLVEESRRGLMLDVQPLESSFLISTKANSGDVKLVAIEQQTGIEKGQLDLSQMSTKENIWLNYFKKPRYTKNQG